MKTRTGETPKFTALGLGNGYPIVLLKDQTGKMWNISTTFQLSLFDYDKVDAPINNIYFPGHAARGSAFGKSAETGVVDGWPVTDQVTNHLPPDNYVSVDSNGRLWYAPTTSGTITPTVAQDSDSIEFMDVIGGNFDLSGSFGPYIVLLGQPRKQTPQTVINQMPTTGAPEGLSSAGIIAFGIGLAGVMLTLARRRN